MENIRTAAVSSKKWVSTSDALPNVNDINDRLLVVRQGRVLVASKDADSWYVPTLMWYVRNDEIQLWMPFPSKEDMTSVEDALPDKRFGRCLVITKDCRRLILNYEYRYDQMGNITGITWWDCRIGATHIYDVAYWMPIPVVE